MSPEGAQIRYTSFKAIRTVLKRLAWILSNVRKYIPINTEEYLLYKSVMETYRPYN